MSYLINNQQKINEIIFAKKNKNYGAYAIRSAYGSTVLRSLMLMTLGMGTFISIAFYMSNRNDKDPEAAVTPFLNDSLISVIYDVNEMEKQKQPEQNSSQPKPKSSPSDAVSTLIKDSVTVNTNTVLNDVIAMNTNSTTGTGPEGPITNTLSGGTGTSTTTTTTVDVEPTPIPDSAPEYKGGLKALYTYLASILKYPVPAFEGGEEGTVYVKFVVDQNGKVGSLSLLNKVGYGMDEEALRVVGLIPKFEKPGMVGGKPVKVYYQLPIKFRMSK